MIAWALAGTRMGSRLLYTTEMIWHHQLPRLAGRRLATQRQLRPAQQVALTDANGTIVEPYAYTAFDHSHILDPCSTLAPKASTTGKTRFHDETAVSSFLIHVGEPQYGGHVLRS